MKFLGFLFALIHSAFCFQGLPEVNFSLIHDDIILSPKQIQMRKYNGIKDATIKERWNNRWENNIVPYQLSNKYTSHEKMIIEDALKTISEVSCFRFPKRTTEKNYLDIDKRDGCYSYVGKVGGRQLLSLSRGCIYGFIIIHEVLHVLGLEHEHQRPDRDEFIKIIYSNVEPDKMSNFGKIPEDDVYYKEHPYDYRSIMHYDGSAFGKTDPKTGRKMVTMIPLQSGIELHDNYELTDLDIRKINDLGKCKMNNRKETTNSSCVDHSQNCSKFKSDGLCDSPKYKSLMQKQCAQSCGYCRNKALRNPSCHDKVVECPAFVANGFCDSKSYDSSILCPKSCGLCN
ncbi:hypothetical protein FO519_001916 [Halicephalobus sp. NKZ332]|nr:hypothetical protein FO519_001916 [Halicephalobus sp. NKZ332]